MTSGLTGGDIPHLEARVFVVGSTVDCERAAFRAIRERTRHARGGRG